MDLTKDEIGKLQQAKQRLTMLFFGSKCRLSFL